MVISSELAAPVSEVWSHVASLEGVNHELRPWFRMTAPAGTELSPATVPLGQPWFRSWLLLLGVLPVDYDALCIERIEAERGFLERSSMLSARVWEHERTLEPLPAGGAGERPRRVRPADPAHGEASPRRHQSPVRPPPPPASGALRRRRIRSSRWVVTRGRSAAFRPCQPVRALAPCCCEQGL
jgi:hypothetical protein